MGRCVSRRTELPAVARCPVLPEEMKTFFTTVLSVGMLGMRRRTAPSPHPWNGRSLFTHQLLWGLARPLSGEGEAERSRSTAGDGSKNGTNHWNFKCFLPSKSATGVGSVTEAVFVTLLAVFCFARPCSQLAWSAFAWKMINMVNICHQFQSRRWMASRSGLLHHSSPKVVIKRRQWRLKRPQGVEIDSEMCWRASKRLLFMELLCICIHECLHTFKCVELFLRIVVGVKCENITRANPWRGWWDTRIITSGCHQPQQQVVGAMLVPSKAILLILWFPLYIKALVMPMLAL